MIMVAIENPKEAQVLRMFIEKEVLTKMEIRRMLGSSLQTESTLKGLMLKELRIKDIGSIPNGFFLIQPNKGDIKSSNYFKKGKYEIIDRGGIWVRIHNE